jgi:uncharacterized Zn finger protein
VSWFYNSKSRSKKTVKKGICAQSTRGGFGTTWLGKKWYVLMESFDREGNRFARGRSYARHGNVQSLEMGAGEIRATVQGSYGKYKVVINITKLSGQEWQRIIDVLAKRVIVASQMVAGSFPESIETIFYEQQLPFLPTTLGSSLFGTAGDLTTRCSCFDFANPCKHVAAILCLLSEEFDRDPFKLVELRGLTRDQFLDKLKIALGLTKPQKATSKKTRSKQEKPEVPAPVPMDPIVMCDFWQAPAPNIAFGACEVPAEHALIPKQLGNLPLWSGEKKFLEEMEETYRLASARALTLLIEQKLGR